MPATLASNSHPRFLLSLIVLIANTAAPVYTHNGRTFLDAGGRVLASQSVVRVRIVGHAESLHGFRAPVGLAKGGTEAYLDLDHPAVLPSLPNSVRCSGPSPAVNQSASRPHPPLRC
jgi:hypothetical protein